MRAISGIEIAVWDLAGKILEVPTSTLLGGKFRNRTRVYDHAGPRNHLDKKACADWAAEVKASPAGFTCHKFSPQPDPPTAGSGRGRGAGAGAGGDEGGGGRPAARVLSARQIMNIQQGCGFIEVHDRPGLGIELNPDVVRAHLAPGETWWG